MEGGGMSPLAAKEELVRTFPVIVTQPVIWGEMDAFQHVNNVVYFRYFENARLEYIRRLDWLLYQEKTGIGPILASTQARFRRALTYPDTIHIGVRLLEMKDDRFLIEHKIVSEKLNDVATEGQGVIVAYHYPTNKKVTLPDELKERITRLEATVQTACALANAKAQAAS
jgi:acyl-CoA thioester hydrolase